ncbi:MAG: carboxypeptidase-like regulatory domain-containing protein [Elusimicrobiota bacterium]|jgi:prepilin-type N-terminal cleavage/methylation domain-containing protein
MIKTGGNRFSGNRGMTLVELMIAISIISISVLAAIGTFRYMSTSLVQSRTKSLASNLGQEQIEKLKNLSYYMLLVTTATHSNSNFTPPIAYDIGNYPSQTIVEGGVQFIRATRVDFASRNGSAVSVLPWNNSDTGAKKVTVYTLWQSERGWQYSELSNLLVNPAADPLNSTLSGTVTKSGGGSLPSALVKVLENPSWYGSADSSGYYSFNVSPGSYTLQASATGYYSKTSGLLSVAAGANVTQNFSMSLIASGTVTGYAYVITHPVISQVVGSTVSASGFDQEYIELFNPTTSYVRMVTGMAISNINLYYQRGSAGSPTQITLDYAVIDSSISPGGYFLIANTTTITAAGVTRTADAVYQTSNLDFPNILKVATYDPGNDAQGLSIVQAGGMTSLDAFGWKIGGNSPGLYEGSPLSQVIGLEREEQYVRKSIPGGVTSGYGRSYDSNNNNTDWIASSSVVYPPRNRSDIELVVSGTPASGALINIDDGLSATTACTDTTVSGDPVCSFSLVGVATGTWTLFSMLNSYYSEIGNVVVPAGVSTGVPNGSTLPVWPATGQTNVLLQNVTDYAFVSGSVYTAAGSPLEGVKVAGGEASTYTGASGRYLLRAPAGQVQVIANADYGMPAYTLESTELTLIAGSSYDPINFYLSQGGRMRGCFQTSSGTPLPGRVAVALKSGSQMAQATSDQSGYFYLVNLATGTYTIEPQLDAAESSSPTELTSVSLSAPGSTLILSTFTVSSSLGQITGQVLASGAPINTGVLVMASTSTLSGTSSSPPPSLAGATGPLCSPCYYATSSQATGEYTLDVRSGTAPYLLYAWYTTFSGNTPTTVRVGPYPVTVTTGGVIMTQDLSW